MEILINIPDKLLRSYLPVLFSETQNGAFIASTTCLTGTAINTLAQQVSRKPKIQQSQQVVRFVLPENKYNNPFRGSFLEITRYNEKKINKALSQEFENNFIKYCLTSKMAGLQTKEVIYNFITEFNLVDAVEHETLRKRIYRTERRAIDDLYGKLRNKYNYNIHK